MLRLLKKICLRGVDLISVALYPVSKLLGRRRIRVLLYHSVCDVPRGQKFSFTIVPTASFARQMEFLSKNGYKVISIDELMAYKAKHQTPPSRSIIITFDDGYADNYKNAFPILQQYKFKATFFIVASYIGDKEVFPWLRFNDKPLIQYEGDKINWLPLGIRNILDMDAHGACFGSHTNTHCSLTKVNEERAIEEIVVSKARLEAMLSRPVRYFSYPFNQTDRTVKSLVGSTGYTAAFSGVGSNSLSSNSLELKRIEIDPRDSMAAFKRRVSGAYDWYYYMISLLISARRALKSEKEQ